MCILFDNFVYSFCEFSIAVHSETNEVEKCFILILRLDNFTAVSVENTFLKIRVKVIIVEQSFNSFVLKDIENHSFFFGLENMTAKTRGKKRMA